MSEVGDGRWPELEVLKFYNSSIAEQPTNEQNREKSSGWSKTSATTELSK